MYVGARLCCEDKPILKPLLSGCTWFWRATSWPLTQSMQRCQATGPGGQVLLLDGPWKAQLHRVVADAKRAEAMVRREVGRAIADAKA